MDGLIDDPAWRKLHHRRNAEDLGLDLSKVFFVIEENWKSNFEEKLNALDLTHEIIFINTGGVSLPFRGRGFSVLTDSKVGHFFHATLKKR